MDGLKRRGKKDLYTLRVHVPQRYRDVVGKEEVWRSTGTDNRAKAVLAAALIRDNLMAEWDARLAGKEAPKSKPHYEAMAELAASRGFPYRPVSEFRPDQHLDDAVDRLLALASTQEDPSSVAAAAIMGMTDAPRRTLSQMAEEMAKSFPSEVASKNDGQAGPWRAKWLRVAKRMIEHLGEDRAIDDLREEDAMSLTAALQKEVDARRLTAGTANKDLSYLNRMIREHHRLMKRPKPVNLFHGHKTKRPTGRKRLKKPSVPIKYLELWLAPGAWGRINSELRDIMLVVMETGCRASEIYNLPPEAIRLDAPIPHILVAVVEEGEFRRELKTEASDREIPLVGAALEAMKRHPEGFPRYRGNRNFNNAANKSMRKAGLLPPDPVGYEWRAGKREPVYVTISGTRHTFEDRLKKARIDTDDRGELLGHDVKRIRGREEYGGMPLEEKLQFHEMIAMVPPSLLAGPPLALPAA
jgi:integrase